MVGITGRELVEQGADIVVDLGMAAVPTTEVQLVAHEGEDRQMVESMLQALRSPGVHGPVGRLVTEELATEELKSAVQLAEVLGPKSPRSKVLLRSTRLLLALREAFGEQDEGKTWQAVRALLKGFAEEGTCAAEASAEVTRIRKELENRDCETMLNTALQHGGASGGLGNCDTSSIETEYLERAITVCAQLDGMSEKLRDLSESATLILELRSNILSNRWTQVEDVLVNRQRTPMLFQWLHKLLEQGTSMNIEMSCVGSLMRLKTRCLVYAYKQVPEPSSQHAIRRS